MMIRPNAAVLALMVPESSAQVWAMSMVEPVIEVHRAAESVEARIDVDVEGLIAVRLQDTVAAAVPVEAGIGDVVCGDLQSPGRRRKVKNEVVFAVIVPSLRRRSSARPEGPIRGRFVPCR